MTTPTPDERHLARARLIEDVCDRFERACQAGPARPEDFLDGVPDDVRAELLDELRQLAAYHGPPADSFEQTIRGGSTPRPDSVERTAPGLTDAGARRLFVPGYEVLGELGRGGMGVVYQARQISLNRLVALKMVLAGDHAGADQLARFQAEAEAVAALHHANIVQVYEVGQAGGLPYLAMELVAGGGLDKKLGGTPLPPREAARLIAVLAGAVAHAHERGLIHRDLKPANVLLTPDGTPKVTDFGLAKRLIDDGRVAATQTGAVVGTPSYMAPEQAGGKSKHVGPEADVWALGAILYECLTGRPPFKADSALETLLQVQTAEPVPPTRLQPRVPRDLETIALKCLRKVPARRYRTAGELADDLRRYLDGQPIAARPVGAAERAWLWARRRPAVAALTALLLLSVVIGFALVTWQWLDAEHHRDQAERAREMALRNVEAEAEARKREAERAEGETKARAQAQDALRAAQLRLYSRGIARADLQLEANNTHWAERLLDDCPPGLRSWEWRYLKGKSREEMMVLEAGDDLTCVAYSPDGRLLATGGADRTVRLWEMPSGRLVTTLGPLAAPITTVRFSPDGTRLAAGCGDLAVLARGEVVVWDIASGKAERTLSEPGHIHQVSFHPDGRKLAVAWRTWVALFDLATGKKERQVNCRSTVYSVAWSPNGRDLAVALNNADVSLWAPEKGDELKRLLKVGTVRRLAFDTTGTRLAVSTTTGYTCLFHLAGSDMKSYGNLRGPDVKILGLAFTPDGQRLLTAGADGRVRAWPTQTPYNILSEWHAHVRGANDVAISPGGQAAATVGGDGRVKVWDLGTNRAPPPPLPVVAAQAVAYLPDGRRFAVVGGRPRQSQGATTVALYDAASRAQLWPKVGTPAMSRAVAARRDGRYLAVAWNMRVAVCDVTNGSYALVGPTIAHHNGVSSVAFSPDGGSLATGGSDGKVKIWLFTTLVRPLLTLRHTIDMELQTIHALAYSPDGKRLATAGDDGSVRVWSPDGKLLHKLTGHKGGALALAFHADGRLASGGADAVIRLWDVATGKQVRALEGHSLAVTGLAFSPSEPRLVSASRDGSLIFWDADEGEEVFAIRRALTGAGGVAFSPDGRYVLAACGGVEAPGGYKLFDGRPDQIMSAPQRQRAWHTREGVTAQSHGRWPAAVRQFDFLAELDPRDPWPLWRRAWSKLHQGDWKGADEDSARYVALGMDVTDLTRYDFSAARMRWFFADKGEYQKMCRAMLARHAKSANAAHLFEASRFCLLSPDAGIDPKVCVEMNQRAISRLKLNWALRYDNLALAHYRAGDWEQAVEAAHKSAELLPTHPFLLERYFVLAMAQHRRGQAEEADKAFAEGVKKLEENDRQWRTATPWLLEEAIHFHNEAAALLKKPARTSLNPRGKR